MAANRAFRFGPTALTNTYTTNILNPAAAGSGTGYTPTASYIVLSHIRILNKTGGAAAAAAGNGGPGLAGEDIGGRYIAPPGVLLALMAGSGAGTTWIVNAGWSWIEVDWPL